MERAHVGGRGGAEASVVCVTPAWPLARENTDLRESVQQGTCARGNACRGCVCVILGSACSVARGAGQ